MRDPATAVQRKQLDALREAIRDKNQQFFYRYRFLNAEYVVGRRLEPFGSVNFPPEMKQLDRDGRGSRQGHLEARRRAQGACATASRASPNPRRTRPTGSN